MPESEWLNKNFLLKALSSYRNKISLEILNFEISRNFGEHYGSEIMQCSIDFSTNDSAKETLKVVIKAIALNDELKMSLVGDSSSKMFSTEIKMYKETLPAISKLFVSNGLKIDFAPECIYVTENPFPVIILKDLSDDGFSSPRCAPKNINDSKIIIQRLAQFHAGSFFQAQRENFDFSAYDNCLFSLNNITDELFRDLFIAFREVVATWEGFEDFLPKIDFIAEKSEEIGRKSYVPNKPGSGYNVLNHGDFHARNTLMKMDSDNRLAGLRIIDFQTCCYCSPSIDINFMFEMVRFDENGEKPRGELIAFYHKEFVETLKAFGYSERAPSLLDLKVELMKHGKLSVLFGIIMTPFAFIDEIGMNLDEALQSSNAESSVLQKKKLYEHPLAQLSLKKALRTWLNNGWLEIE